MDAIEKLYDRWERQALDGLTTSQVAEIRKSAREIERSQIPGDPMMRMRFPECLLIARDKYDKSTPRSKPVDASQTKAKWKHRATVAKRRRQYV